MTRRTVELGCRALALVSLLAALVTSWRAGDGQRRAPARRLVVRLPDARRPAAESAALTVLRGALVARVTAPGGASTIGGDTLVMPLSALPAAGVRAALGSMRASGVPIRWYDSTAARGLAASIARLAVPGAPLDVRVSVARGGIAPTAVRLGDAGGRLDSLVVAGAVTSWRLASATAPLRVEQGRGSIAFTLPDSTPARRILVLAQPGWEGKFVVAALEEAGWLVDGTMRVSPTGAVTIGAPQRLDTLRYAAVVVTDSMAVDAAALTRFVARGGGVVLGGDAMRVPALQALSPARPSVLRGAIAGALLTAAPRRGLEAWEVAPAADAVVLEVDRGDHTHDEPALLARRLGAGRVVAMPYHETWRWRMQGTDDGLAAHRAWWHHAVSSAVGSADAAPPDRAAPADAYPGDGAPYADLVARAGAPQPWEATAPGGRDAGDERLRTGDIPLWRRPWVLLLVTLAALLAEWSSRRLRGAR